MKPLLLVILLQVLISCGKSEEDPLTLDDLAPVSENYKEGTTVGNMHEEPEKSKPSGGALASLADTLSGNLNWKIWDTVLFPDRFGAQATEKWLAIAPNDSIVLLHYAFRDSLRTRNAFFNWIDCFGTSCTSYGIGGNIRVKNRNALILVGEREMLYYESGSTPDEMRIRASFFDRPEKENWLYVIRIPRYGKTTWKRIVKGEEKPIVRNDENR